MKALPGGGAQLRITPVAISNGKPGAGETGLTTATVSDESACFLLRREQFELTVIARFEVAGEPASKSRARFTKRGSKMQAYTPEKTHLAEQAVAWNFKRAAPQHRPDSVTAYGVMALFFCGTQQRRDVDNMLKLVLDGLNKIAWADDSQVDEVSARRTLVRPGEARTEIMVYEIGPAQRCVGTCQKCGKDFPMYKSWNSVRRFCSAECHAAFRDDRKRQNCEHCGREFLRGKPNVAQAYCSPDCAAAGRRKVVPCDHCGAEFSKQRCHVRAKNYCSEPCQVAATRECSRRNARGTCETCGGPTSKKTYRQCNKCRVAGTGVSGKPKGSGA